MDGLRSQRCQNDCNELADVIGTFIISTHFPLVMKMKIKQIFYWTDLAMNYHHVQKTYLDAKFWNFEGTLFPETLKVG